MGRVASRERPTGVDRLRDDRSRPRGRRADRGRRPGHRLRPQRARRRRRHRHQAARPRRSTRWTTFVRDDARDAPACSRSSTTALTLAEAEEQVLAYIKEHCPDGSRPPLAGNTVATDRSFLARDMPDARGVPALPDRRRLLDQGAVAALVPPRLLQRADQARQPPRARRHPGEHRGAALLPRGRLRAPARARQRHGQARSPPSTAARSPGSTGDAGGDPRFRGPRSDPSRLSSRPDPGALMVGVAQLVERRVVVADVAGSSPVTHPMPTAPDPHRGRGRCHVRIRSGSPEDEANAS